MNLLQWGRSIAALTLVALLALAAVPATARDQTPIQARAGLELASDAARSWSVDAVLIYVENDEDVDASGGAVRWGYLFYSAALDQARGYSVRDGKIVTAENLDMKLEAPPVDGAWIDSGAAIVAADDAVSTAYKKTTRGTLASMLLMRGAFSEGDPDQTTWTLVYHSAGQAPLFVVVDALGGKVRRTWRG